MPGTNTLAYFAIESVTKKKKFYDMNNRRAVGKCGLCFYPTVLGVDVIAQVKPFCFFISSKVTISGPKAKLYLFLGQILGRSKKL
jgi:hypothetical protein